MDQRGDGKPFGIYERDGLPMIDVKTGCRPVTKDYAQDRCGTYFAVPPGAHTVEVRTTIVGQTPQPDSVRFVIQTRCDLATRGLRIIMGRYGTKVALLGSLILALELAVSACRSTVAPPSDVHSRKPPSSSVLSSSPAASTLAMASAPEATPPPAQPPPAAAAAPPQNLDPQHPAAAAGKPGRWPSAWARVPEAVAEEEAHLDSAYSKLERLDLLPDFLSLNDVVALYPEPEVREELRERVRAQLRGEDAEVLFGAHFDEQGRWFLLWLRDEALTQVAAVYDRGRRTHRQEFFRGVPRLRDVLGTRAEQAAGRDLPELVVERITSPSMCCLPVDWEVYRLTPWGSLANVLTFPKDHHEVGPGIRWTFVNHFDFTPDQRVRITRIFPEPEPDTAPAQGPWELTYSEAAGRYLPTAETAARLRREQQKRAVDQHGLE